MKIIFDMPGQEAKTVYETPKRPTILVDVVYLAEAMEKDWDYSVDTPWQKDVRYAFARTRSGRRRRRVVNAYSNGERVGVYDAPYSVKIFD